MQLGAIKEFCECLTDVKYKYNPAYEREFELEELMVTLLTPGKSSLLIGKQGVGKTAIVEGLAYNIQNNKVPKSLKGFKIYKTSAAMLNSNCIYNGMLEKNVLDLFSALEHEDKVILFVDEIHTFVGTGRSLSRNSLDIANIIKPFITSENIRLIGATTDYEYEDYIKDDPAFSRRFDIISIKEPSESALRCIISKAIEKYSKMYNIQIDKILHINVSTSIAYYTSQSYRNDDDLMYNPDLAISIVAKAFGYARLYDKKQIEYEDFIRAYNNSQRVVGDFKLLTETSKVAKIINASNRFKHS